MRASTAPFEAAPSEDPKTELFQLQALTAAYKDVTTTEPWLPSRESPLPALIAIRNTNRTINETRETIAKTELDLKVTTDKVEKERADLGNTFQISTELVIRMNHLQTEISERTQKTPDSTLR